MTTRLRWILALLLLGACAGDPDRFDRNHVSAGLEERTGRRIGPGDGALPPGVTQEDGLSENEAVTMALWNNSGFQEALAELGIKRADLIQAGLLPNPVFSVLFPLGPKQLEMTLKMSMDALWLRPGRVAAAKLDCERVSALLVQNGLDLIRDVRAAYADLRAARRRASLARDLAGIRERLSTLTAARLRAGDIGELEAEAARVEATRARADATRALCEQNLAIHRLRALIGLAQHLEPVAFDDPGADPGPDRDGAALMTRALAARPDLRAAELAIDAAKERVSLSDLDFLAVNAGADSNSKGKKGFEIGPALDVGLPIFNQGQGSEARALAELERAVRHQATVRDRIALDVRESQTAYAAAREAATAQQDLVRILEESIRTAERAEKAGDIAPQVVLESRLRLLDGQLREADARAELHRAAAQLERSVGGRLP